MTPENQETIKKMAQLYNQIQVTPFDSLLRIAMIDEYFGLIRKLREDLPDFNQLAIDEIIFEESQKLRCEEQPENTDCDKSKWWLNKWFLFVVSIGFMSIMTFLIAKVVMNIL